jgi:hypothetical protein
MDRRGELCSLASCHHIRNGGAGYSVHRHSPVDRANTVRHYGPIFFIHGAAPVIRFINRRRDVSGAGISRRRSVGAFFFRGGAAPEN